ncbi:unnamed protein product [Somion occarium]
MTVGVGGGAALKFILDNWSKRFHRDASCSTKATSPLPSWWQRLKTWLASLDEFHRNFVSNLISAYMAIVLLQSRRRLSRNTPPRAAIPMTALTTSTPTSPSFTLDLTLLFVVRAIDSLVRSKLLPCETKLSSKATREEKDRVRNKRQQVTTRLDAFVFWASSARIMWCFFYEPDSLPRSYNKWIMSLANIDPRLLHALRAIRSDSFSYVKGFSIPPDLVSGFSRDLGYPSAWGDPALLPGYGGAEADRVWKTLGVTNRSGVGGLPCELVHSGFGSSCTANAGVRGIHAFAEALAIYIPVHILPILLTRPRTLLQKQQIVSSILSILRSASFLSTFVSSIWFAICMTRTLFLARLFPSIPHDFWDGPFGCTFIGSLVCGSSIWVEEGKRRGEMALYVLPRAIRACIPKSWLTSGRRSVRVVERLAFVLSLATLLTASSQSRESLRGLSRWTLSFVMKGPNTGFWKRKRQDASTTATLLDSSSPRESSPPPDTQQTKT